MPVVPENIITRAEVEPETCSVRLIWAHGATTEHRFGHLVGKGAFAAFADSVFFAQAMVGERGRSLLWPGEVEFCADALWFEAHPEDAPRQELEIAIDRTAS
jgi:hypothetical protein